MEEWKECNIGDITTYKKGFAFKLDDYKSSGRRIVKVSNLNQDIYDESKYVYLDLSEVEKHKDVILKKSDIVISTVGSWPNNPNSVVGKVTRIPQYLDGSLLNQNAVIFRGNNEVSQDFLYYLLKDDLFTNYIIGTAQGSASQASIKLTDIMNYPVHLPPLPTQQKIAAILSSLDDKIELNNKINENLKQQAQALFKSWFVDFEPFGGKMPEGWKEGTIGDLCSTISKSYKGNDSNVVLINTSDVENGSILNHDTVPNSNLKGQFKKTFQKGDILYSEIRPANKHYAFVDIEETSNYIASTKLMVIRPNEGINSHYLYHILTNPELIQEMQHLAETRSGTFPQITFESELSTYPIPLLPKEEQDKLGELFEKIDNQIFHNIKENNQLSTIRDTLLPKLMNGEIEI